MRPVRLCIGFLVLRDFYGDWLHLESRSVSRDIMADRTVGYSERRVIIAGLRTFAKEVALRPDPDAENDHVEHDGYNRRDLTRFGMRL